MGKKRKQHFKRSQTVGTSMDSDQNNNFQKFYRRSKPNKSKKNNRQQSRSSEDSELSNSDSGSDDNIPIKIKTKSKRKISDNIPIKIKSKPIASKQKLRSKTPIPRSLTKSKKSSTLVESDLNFEIGHDADLSVFALDSKKRDAIKANKNATFGGFKLKINYRYRLDDNR